MKQKRAFGLSLAAGVLLFAVIFPYQHDMYISPVFTAICIFLNGCSAVLFASLLNRQLLGKLNKENGGIFLWFLLLLAAGHAIFAMMNWGSWLCLALTVPSLFVVVRNYRQGN